MRQETLAETLRELAERRDAKRAAEAAYLDVADRVPEDLWNWHSQASYLRGYDDAKAEMAHTEMLLREAQDELANAQARVRELEAFIEAQAAHDHHAERDEIKALRARVAEGVDEISNLTGENESLKFRVRELARQNGILMDTNRAEHKNAQSAWDRVRELEAQLAKQPQPAAVGVVGAVLGYGITDGKLIGPWIDETRDRAEQRLRVSSSYNRVVAIVDPDAIVPLASGTAARWRHDQLDRVWHHRDLAACAGYGTVSPLYPGLAQPAQERDA
jgi:hypothetical protein